MFDPFKKLLRGKGAPSPAPAPAPGEISLKKIKNSFSDCADLSLRQVAVGDTGLTAWAVWLEGVCSSQSITETVVRPLSRLDGPGELWACLDHIQSGGVYGCVMQRRTAMTDVIRDLTLGYTALVFDQAGTALCIETRSSETRGVQQPTVEKSVLGAKDAFVENFRVNTSLVRRQLRSPELKLWQTTVGRRSGTPVGVLYLQDIAREEVIAEVKRRLETIDIDGFTSAGDLEQYLADRPRNIFPRLMHTERPDRFARALLQGRVGLLVDGLPVGFLLPGTLPEMLRVSEDRARHAVVASALLLIRWAAMAAGLLLPALYVAVAMYHQEMIPLKLLQSIIQSKQEVPFTVAAEVLGMLLIFELLQEAGLRLPDPVGQTVSIIGALIVGQSAVEARVISPIAVIVVALSGICGYTQPSQELGAALRLWRMLLAVCAMVMGMYGLMAGLIVLLWLLCDMESFGLAYLHPLCDGGRGHLVRTFLRLPLGTDKFRDPAVAGRNRRKQR